MSEHEHWWFSALSWAMEENSGDVEMCNNGSMLEPCEVMRFHGFAFDGSSPVYVPEADLAREKAIVERYRAALEQIHDRGRLPWPEYRDKYGISGKYWPDCADIARVALSEPKGGE